MQKFENMDVIAAPVSYTHLVTAVFSCAGNEFAAKGKTVLVPGWKEIDQRFRSTLKADGEEETAVSYTHLITDIFSCFT